MTQYFPFTTSTAPHISNTTPHMTSTVSYFGVNATSHCQNCTAYVRPKLHLAGESHTIVLKKCQIFDRKETIHFPILSYYIIMESSYYCCCLSCCGCSSFFPSHLILKALCGCVCLSVTNFLNWYKMANNGWISNFKVSIEAYEHSASNYHFRIFKNQKFN